VAKHGADSVAHRGESPHPGDGLSTWPADWDGRRPGGPREHLDLRNKYDGPEARETGDALATLGMNLLGAGGASPPPSRCSARASRLYEKHPFPEWQRGRVANMLGAAVAGVGKNRTRAERLVMDGYEAMKREEAKIPAPWKRYLADAGTRVVRFYESAHQPVKADEWRKKLVPARAGRAVTLIHRLQPH